MSGMLSAPTTYEELGGTMGTIISPLSLLLLTILLSSLSKASRNKILISIPIKTLQKRTYPLLNHCNINKTVKKTTSLTLHENMVFQHGEISGILAPLNAVFSQFIALTLFKAFTELIAVPKTRQCRICHLTWVCYWRSYFAAFYKEPSLQFLAFCLCSTLR